MLELIDTALYLLGLLVGITTVTSILIFILFAASAVRAEWREAMQERRHA